MKRCALYQHCDGNGQILYVGITDNPAQRLQQHYKSSDWATKIASVNVQWFGDRQAASNAEILAIRSLNPPYNRANVAPQPAGREGNFRDGFLAEYAKSGASVMDIAKATGCSRFAIHKMLTRESASTSAENAVLIAQFFGTTVEAMCAQVSA